jgi:hypothetical protein
MWQSMSPSASRIIEKVFLGYYIAYSLYFLYLINNDGGILHLADPIGWVPSLLFGVLIGIYQQLRRRYFIWSKVVLTLLIIYHSLIIFAMHFYIAFTSEEGSFHSNDADTFKVHLAIAYIGIGLSLVLLITRKKWIPTSENDE